jgi:PTS system nitrogen regulatory IIA component
MELHVILNRKCCSVKIAAKDKVEVLESLAELAMNSPLLENFSAKQIYSRLASREEQGSTGFGNEVAIPHARIAGMKEFLLFIVLCPKGVAFDSVDKKKVKLFFVILGPEEMVNDHLQVLASVSRVLSGEHVKNELLKSPTPVALSEAFLRHAHAGVHSQSVRRKMKLFVLILYLEELLYDVLEFFIQEGIDGATILDSAGMSKYISNVPLFAEFIGFMQHSKDKSKTIIALVPEDQVENIAEGIESMTGNLDKKDGAMIFAIDVGFYRGTMKMM